MPRRKDQSFVIAMANSDKEMYLVATASCACSNSQIKIRVSQIKKALAHLESTKAELAKEVTMPGAAKPGTT